MAGHDQGLRAGSSTQAASSRSSAWASTVMIECPPACTRKTEGTSSKPSTSAPAAPRSQSRRICNKANAQAKHRQRRCIHLQAEHLVPGPDGPVSADDRDRRAHDQRHRALRQRPPPPDCQHRQEAQARQRPEREISSTRIVHAWRFHPTSAEEPGGLRERPDQPLHAVGIKLPEHHSASHHGHRARQTPRCAEPCAGPHAPASTPAPPACCSTKTSALPKTPMCVMPTRPSNPTAIMARRWP